MVDELNMTTVKNIAYVPSSSSYLQNKIFSSQASQDLRHSPFSFLRKLLTHQDYNINTYDYYLSGTIEVDFIIVTRIDYNFRILKYLKKKFPISKVIYLVTEEITVAPIHEPSLLDQCGFDAIITWNITGFNKTNIIKYFYPNPHHRPDRILFSGAKNRNIDLVMIAANKKPRDKRGEQYTLRARLAKELLNFPGFRLYGNGWSDLIDSPNYSGVLEQKKDILPTVKFGMAIENTSNEEGAITEKIFDFFSFGVVPIYAGAPDIQRYIPSDCYIDYHLFPSTLDLIQFVKAMPNDQYSAMQRNIYDFLRSEQFDQFSWRGFALAVHTALELVASEKPKSFNFLRTFMMLTKLSPSFPLRYLLRKNAV